MSVDSEYLVALSLTVAVETPLVVAALGRWYGVGPWRGAGLAILGSLITHPAIWFVLAPTLPQVVGYVGFVLVAEGFAWLAEGLVFRLALRRDLPGLLLVSLGANLASYLVGAGLLLAGVWPGA